MDGKQWYQAHSHLDPRGCRWISGARLWNGTYSSRSRECRCDASGADSHCQNQGDAGGSPFTLTINIALSNGLHPAPGTPFGSVTGTFRGQTVTAMLIPDPPKYQFRFQGSIGSRKVSGIVQNFTRHGHTTTAHATFTVSR